MLSMDSATQIYNDIPHLQSDIEFSILQTLTQAWATARDTFTRTLLTWCTHGDVLKCDSYILEVKFFCLWELFYTILPFESVFFDKSKYNILLNPVFC